MLASGVSVLDLRKVKPIQDMLQHLRTYLGGFLMGMADLVPGVSGGTIALVLGIYERLVASVKEGSSALLSLLKRDVDGFKTHLQHVEWGLLIPLLAGILSAVLLLASFIEHQIEQRPQIVAGLFFGLVVGSVFIAWGLIKRPQPRYLPIAAVVGLLMFVLLGFGEGSEAADPSALAFFGAGALAICAMILPGISGSLILLIIGMYKPVLNAVSDREIGTIVLVGLGAVCGLAIFSQILSWALEHHHDPVLAALIGLMIGSTRVLWPWPSGVEGPELARPGDDWFRVVIAMAAGLAIVFAISRLSRTVPEPSHQSEDLTA